jgi:hypothetical protein
MKRVYIFKDGVQQGSTATKESAVNLIRRYQKLETHRMLRAERKNLSPIRRRRSRLRENLEWSDRRCL